MVMMMMMMMMVMVMMMMMITFLLILVISLLRTAMIRSAISHRTQASSAVVTQPLFKFLTREAHRVQFVAISARPAFKTPQCLSSC